MLKLLFNSLSSVQCACSGGIRLNPWRKLFGYGVGTIFKHLGIFSDVIREVKRCCERVGIHDMLGN